jgi:hypothetical protein
MYDVMQLKKFCIFYICCYKLFILKCSTILLNYNFISRSIPLKGFVVFSITIDGLSMQST